MNRKHTDKLLAYVLLSAGRLTDRTQHRLRTTDLLHYLYLADLGYAEWKGGEPFTGIEWAFHALGPWNLDAHERVRVAMSKAGAKVHTPRSKAKAADPANTSYSLRDKELFERMEEELPGPLTIRLHGVVLEHGNDSDSLLSAVYITAPMVHAAPGEPLDLSLVALDHDLLREVRTRMKAPAKKKKAPQRAARIAQAKARFEELQRAKQVRESPLSRPPRLEVFDEVRRWVDSLAGEEVGEKEGELHFDPSVWNSKMRRMEDGD